MYKQNRAYPYLYILNSITASKIKIIIFLIGFEYEIDNRRLIADEDDEDYEYEEIDLDNLPNDQ